MAETTLIVTGSAVKDPPIVRAFDGPALDEHRVVAALEDEQMHELAETATTLGLDILVQTHNADEVERALKLDTKLIGINNRDLRTFETSLQTTLDLKQAIPDDRLIITESGIHTQEDIQLMLDNDIYTFLVGEAFMRADYPGQKMRELFSL